MKTGKEVQTLWLYSSECCELEVLFNSGDTFSRCPRCSSLCNWEKADITSEEMKALRDKSRLQTPWARRPESRRLELRHSY